MQGAHVDHIAIIGCGQLARMMALEGLPLGISFSFVAQAEESTRAVAGLGAVCEWAPGMDSAALYAALGRPDVVTVEKEQVDTGMLRGLEAFCQVLPNGEALYQCQNRLRQKALLEAVGLPCTPYMPLAVEQDLRLAVQRFGLPLVIKHTEHGYDGKSQWLLRSDEDCDQWVAKYMVARDVSGCWLVERCMPFDRELSFLAVRGRDGSVRFYPPTQNQHRHSVLISSLAPAPDISEALRTEGQDGLGRLLSATDYVGVMAMECFDVGGQLWVNELAPRVHNSGHWTQRASLTSQFENHLRAIAGWPLGSTELEGGAAMLNLLGVPLDQAAMLRDGGCLNWYNKEVRPGRKVGHINIHDSNPQAAHARLSRLQEAIYGSI
ncbi:5-(carboxyamino)imidazole ribonucleotide synthase [Ketobacter alkanivorans]|uniref:N5-carboxyaminoimidazole ribonucleotide synthase n=1 Tax=Ketobacter alkanivorans TaxID=1917421 RepID=A0A2K9LM00_9GAMM|nr:5-(carboxyamino)imidazole ribonucleotide synthase [Ketobacter alkanivorans]AUM13302.1 5-(carboxyamino)imidazole ribonucleotide synthase [Ketobacter alkanivorans]